MKKFTNHAPGMRGINTKAGVVWIEPGKSASIDPKHLVGELPDLGEAKVAPVDDDADLIASVQTENEALKVQVADLTKTNGEQVKEIEALKKAAKAA